MSALVYAILFFRYVMHYVHAREIVFRGVVSSATSDYYNMDSISELQDMGASLPIGADIQKTGYVDLNLSKVIDRTTAKRISTEIPKLIANQKDFYEIKAILYFELDYSYTDYINDLKNVLLQTFPLQWNPVLCRIQHKGDRFSHCTAYKCLVLYTKH